MHRSNSLPWLLLPIVTALPQVASAHLVSTRFGEFYSGLLHPLTTLIHLVPWVALALFAALQGKAFARRSLVLFPLFVALGVAIGIAFPGYGNILLLNIISFVVLGGLVALSLPVPLFPGLVLVGLFGLSHGYANGDVSLEDASLTLYLGGVTTAAYLVSALGAGAAVALSQRWDWGSIALRALGSWILAAGLIYGGFEFMAAGRA